MCGRTFISQRLDGHGSGPEAEGVCGLRQDPAQPQRTILIQAPAEAHRIQTVTTTTAAYEHIGRPPSGTWGQVQAGLTYPTMLLVDTLLDSRLERPRREPRRGWRKLSEG